MKKMIGVFALCLASSLAFAEEASVQKVLDSVHGIGFVGCDEELRKEFSGSGITHVETHFLFPSAQIKDEVFIAMNNEMAYDYGWESRISLHMVRKVAKQCVISQIDTVSNTNFDCAQLAKNQMYSNVVAETYGATWMNYGRGNEARGILISSNRGGCRVLRLP